MKKASRIPVLIVITAWTLFMATGCGNGSSGPTSGQTSASAEKVQIRVETTFTGADSYKETWHQVIKDFMDKNHNVEIIDEATPGAGNAFKIKLDTDFAQGNEPDVAFGFTGSDGQALIESGKLLDWDGELSKDTSWASNFLPSALDAVKVSGKVYGLPFIGFYEGMFINKDLFDKFKIKVPTSYEELLTAVDAFKGNGIIPIAASFSEEPHYLIETFILSLGGKQGHMTPFDPSWAPALNYIRDLYQRGAFSSDAITINSAAAQQLFIDKKAAMFISGSWSAGAFTDQNNTKVIPLPMLTGGKADPSDSIYGFGSAWYVSKAMNDEKNGVPVAFVKYLTTPEVLSKFIAVAGVPGLKCSAPGITPVQQSGFDMIAKARNIDIPIDKRISPEAFTKIWKGLQYVVTSKKTAEGLLKEARALTDN